MSQNNSQTGGLNGTVNGAETSLVGTLSDTQQIGGVLNQTGSLSGGLSTSDTQQMTGILNPIGSLNGELSASSIKQMIGVLNPIGNLSGGLSVPQSMSLNNVLVGTTAEWNAKPTLIGRKNTVYVYSDRYINESGEAVPGFKVGDGLAYLIDLPFNDDIMVTHINNSSIHVTDEERAFWNNKVTAYLNPFDTEELILDNN